MPRHIADTEKNTRKMVKGVGRDERRGRGQEEMKEVKNGRDEKVQEEMEEMKEGRKMGEKQEVFKRQ